MSNKKLDFHINAVYTGFIDELTHDNVLTRNAGPLQDELLLNPDKGDETCTQ